MMYAVLSEALSVEPSVLRISVGCDLVTETAQKKKPLNRTHITPAKRLAKHISQSHQVSQYNSKESSI